MKKIFSGIFRKKVQRIYLRVRENCRFIFNSDVELKEEDINFAMDIILYNSAGHINGNETARQIFERFHESNAEIASCKINCTYNHKNWFVKVSIKKDEVF